MKDEKTSPDIARVAGKVLRGEFNQPTIIDDAHNGVLVPQSEYNELLFIAQALAGSCLTQVANRGITNKQEKERGKKEATRIRRRSSRRSPAR